MGKEKSTLTHYKNGKNPIGRLFDFELRKVITDFLHGNQKTLDLLSATFKFEGDTTKENVYCSALKKADEVSQQAQQTAAQDKFASRPKGIMAAACESQRKLFAAKQVIKDEDAVAREAGTTNLINRNQAGRQIVAQQKAIESFKAQYKKKTGKALNLKAYK